MRQCICLVNWRLNESSNFTVPFIDPRLLPTRRKSSISRAASRINFNQASKTSGLLDDMRNVGTVITILGSLSSITQTIEELENAVQAWHQTEHKKRIPSSSKPKSDKEKEKPKDASKEGMFGIFKKSQHTYLPPSSRLTCRTNIRQGHSSGHTPPEVIPTTDDKSSITDAGTPSSPYDRLQSAIASLKAQHVTLSGLIPFVDNNPPSVHASPLATVEEPSSDGSHSPARISSPIARKTWGSTVTSLSDGGSIWFDATDEPDGAEEFFLDAPPMEAGAVEDRIPMLDGQSSSHLSGESSDTDEEEGVGRLSLVVNELGAKTGNKQVVSRTTLPSGPVGDEGSLFALFKKNVGKVDFIDTLCMEHFLTLSKRISLVSHSP